MTLPQYIEKMGIRKTADLLGVSPQTVLQWKNLETTPRPMTAYNIIEVTKGLLDWEDIYKPYVLNQLGYKNPNQKSLFDRKK